MAALRNRRVVRWVGIGSAIALALVVGHGLTGGWDRSFAVQLVNRTGESVVVNNHGTLVRLRPGETDTEWGSSTARQAISVQLGTRKTCADLYFRKAPRRPVPITLKDGDLKVATATSC
jgi:hypothetical protein